MSTTTEVIDVAKKAINEAFSHYFNHLIAGDEKKYEINYIVELLKTIQGWLFFNEQSIEHIYSTMKQDTANTNLIWNLTLLFHSRFTLNDTAYENLLDHLTNAFSVEQCEDPKLSLVSMDHRDRLVSMLDKKSIMKNNRHIVVLACMILFLDTGILSEALQA